MPLLLAIETFNVKLVFALLGLSGKGLIFRLLINLFTNHVLIIIIADEFDNVGWVNGIADLIGIYSDCAESHFITGGK